MDAHVVLSKHDSFTWEISNRSSCDVCLEPYDASLVIPRVLSCGHSRCEQCIVKCITRGNVFKCVCQKETVVRDVKTLPVNRSLIDISDFMGGIALSLKPVDACTECKTAVDHKWLAVCKTEGCDKYRKLICLSCAMKQHGKHDYVLYEYIMDDVRAKCQEELVKLQSCARAKCARVQRVSRQIADRMSRIESQFFHNNDTSQLLFDQASKLIDEKEAAELLAIGVSFLDPVNKELSAMLTGLEAFHSVIDNVFGEDSGPELLGMYIPAENEHDSYCLHRLFDP